MPRRTSFDDDHYDDEPSGKRRSSSSWQRDDEDTQRRKPAHHDMRKVAEGRESFKCGHCRAFVGPTIAGGKHRNHCPLCLYSRHVDLGHPGDRRCECRSLMEPIGLCSRRGEELLVHRCLGCGAERVCRVAADDNPVPLGELPFVPYPGREAEQGDVDPALERPG